MLTLYDEALFDSYGNPDGTINDCIPFIERRELFSIKNWITSKKTFTEFLSLYA